MEAFEIIRATMKEFDCVEDETVNTFISLSEPYVSRKRFGKLYQQALAYMAAHKMKLSGYGSTGAVGAAIGDTFGLASVSEGGTSVSFSNNTQTADADSEYSMTVYGVQFLHLRRSVIVPVCIRSGVDAL
jgi:hypothetical protein